MTPAARLASAAVILDTLDSARPVEPHLKAWARSNRYAGSGDRRAIADRVYTCLRRRGSCAAQAGGETGRALVLGSLVAEDGLSVEEIAALCTGGYGLDPLTEPERATLGRSVRDDPRIDWPAWLLPEAERAFGPDLAAELSALRGRAPLDLRVNTLKATPDDIRALLDAEGLDAVPVGPTALRLPPGSPAVRTKPWRDGLIEPQDAASQSVAAFAQARPGETVLDYCAGAGGKALALAAAMGNRGRLFVHDIDPARMAPLPERAARAGATIIEAGLPEPDSCDCVFVDAPCSGSGSWRRDPAGKWRLDPARLATLQAAQREALAAAATYVRPGGRLVYVTCSVLPSENDDQAVGFTLAHPAFTQLETLHLHPARDGADGFFAARFTRSGFTNSSG